MKDYLIINFKKETAKSVISWLISLNSKYLVKKIANYNVVKESSCKNYSIFFEALALISFRLSV